MTGAAVGNEPATSRAGAGSSPLLPALLVFFGVFALLLGLGDRLLNDPDTWWHIAVGERIWSSGTFPRTDELSHTFAGAPWIAKEWLSQVLLHAAWSIAGWRGVAVLAAAVAAAAFALLYHWLGRRLRLAPAIVLTAIVVALSAGQILARPHIFFFPLLVVWVGALVDAVERRQTPPWWLVVVVVVWSNAHASIPIAFALAGLLGLEAIVRAPADRRLRTGVGWALFGLASVAAAGVTPYGYGAILVAIDLFGSGEAFRYIAEWQPLARGLSALLPYAALAAAVALLIGAPRRHVFRLAIVLVCGYLMVSHVRFTSLFGIVAALVVATPLGERFPAIGRDDGDEAPIAGPWPAAALLVLMVGSLVLAATVNPMPDRANAPSAALAAARERGLAAGPVFNSYDFGGYLIANGVPTFIDGRSDQLFGGGFMSGLNDSLRGGDRDRFAGILDRHAVTWALVRPGTAEAAMLDALPGWRDVYRDEVAVVLARGR